MSYQSRGSDSIPAAEITFRDGHEPEDGRLPELVQAAISVLLRHGVERVDMTKFHEAVEAPRVDYGKEPELG